MNANKRNTGSDLKRVDSHAITADEYEELPELTDEFFEQADEYVGEKLIRRGRPRKAVIKQPVSVRFSDEVLRAFRASGPGWQTRMDAALRDWLKDHDPGRMG